jgi:hypothetical protein
MRSSAHASCQGQPVGRCSSGPLAQDAIRAGTVISLRAMVVVALASDGPAMLAAARVRLNAMTARTSARTARARKPETLTLNSVTALTWWIRQNA